MVLIEIGVALGRNHRCSGSLTLTTAITIKVQFIAAFNLRLFPFSFFFFRSSIYSIYFNFISRNVINNYNVCDAFPFIVRFLKTFLQFPFKHAAAINYNRIALYVYLSFLSYATLVNLAF